MEKSIYEQLKEMYENNELYGNDYTGEVKFDSLIKWIKENDFLVSEILYQKPWLEGGKENK